MRVRTFYQACKNSALYETLQGTNENFEFAKAVSKACSLLRTETCREAVLGALRESLEESYRSEWFRFSFQKEVVISDNVKKFERFLNWLSTYGSYRIVEANVTCEATVLSTELTCVCNLLIEKEDCSYEGIVLQVGKNPFSFKGKSTHTLATNNLFALLPKYCFERKYPRMTMSVVYLTQDKDTLGNVQDHFLITQGKGSNVHRLFFDEFYSEGEFLEEEFYTNLCKIVSVPVSKNCYLCSNQALCNSQTLANKPSEEVVEREYSVPDFTSSQMEVVNHEKGPMLVIAGPGSGKTAALVGRIKALMDKGVDTDYMLVITFTKEAAKELRTRCLSFCDESNLPTISTIHAICYQILKDNADLLGVEYELLSTQENLQIIEGLLEAFPLIKGLKYNVIQGQFGLLKTVARKLEEYILGGCDSVAFLAKESDLGKDFIELADYYVERLKVRNFITFDEQIIKCNALLKDYPEVCDSYNAIYQYLMVDEFQDINADQAEFIHLISKHQNIIAVGDDDQNIYGFRGGSNEYMLNFEDAYPKATRVIFRENFRATEALANASSNIILANQNRIAKDLTAVRKGGSEPVYVNGNSSEFVDAAIEKALANGYSYKDIAVLSQKNSTLEELKEKLQHPCVLEKAYLINEPLFVACFYPLALIKSNYMDNLAMLRLCRLFDIPLELSLTTSLYDAVSFNKDEASARLMEFIDVVNELTKYSPLEYIRAIATTLDLEGTKAHNVLNELIFANELTTLEQFYKKTCEMVLYEDDTKVSVTNVDAVLLITNHESKGKEFPVVILVGDSEPTSEEARRVLYVAMTRAEDLLFVLSKPGIEKTA